jgi:hypothetical protein
VLLRLNEQLTAGFSPQELDTVARWMTQVAQLHAR